ncbi:diguanylate cyclase domain-containing protein [Accumulibacter sp.]|uniref:diguanylate cyclase domain-containing protein n=1 Tax=Accumulibacter sp. TaxID=2053492 RepID=UPI0028C44D85|nr:diguanylate cyclase [Accumulibacter sp.]
MPPCLLAQNNRRAMLSAGQLRRRYIMALLLIAILTVAAQGVLQLLFADQKFDSHLINVAGRQRMLSQKITALSYYIATAESADADARDRQKLAAALSLWERSHVGLLQGNSEMGLPGHNNTDVVKLFADLQPHHEAIVAAAGAILSAAGSAATLAQNIATLKEHEADFLAGMNEIVTRYDREANAKVEFARWLELGLMSTTLLVLALTAVFICAPATRRIQQDMKDLADREEDLERLYSASPTALLLVSSHTLTILHANQKAIELLGVAVADKSTANLRTFLDANHDANRYFLDKISKGETFNEYELVLLDARAAVFETLVSVRTISFSGQTVFVLGITNISELKRAQETLQHYATFDELTGLLNRRTGLMMLGKSMAKVRRDGGLLTVCFVDLDGLKATNDGFGHAAGDWLIGAAAKALTGGIRSSDAVVRLGGDEFLLILHDCSLEEGSRLLGRAETRLQAISAAELKPFPIGFSYGLTNYAPETDATPDDLISEADSLMYRAKQEKKRLPAVS